MVSLLRLAGLTLAISYATALMAPLPSMTNFDSNFCLTHGRLQSKQIRELRVFGCRKRRAMIIYQSVTPDASANVKSQTPEDDELNDFLEETKTKQEQDPEFVWEVFVSQSTTKNNEKGVIPSSSVIEAFVSLAPSPEVMKVYPAVWNKQNKNKGKGHLVRLIKKRYHANEGNRDVVQALEIINVDSVDKVYRIMTEHMKLGEINPKACDCMRCYFQGNERLDEQQPSQAISLYNQALYSANHHPKKSAKLPKGSILMKRARAYLQRASNHRKILRILVKDLTETVPTTSTVQLLYQTASANSPLSFSIFNRLAQDSKIHQSKFRQVRYRHDMYEFALLHAAQDSLEATQLLPQNAKAWLLAGECLAELRKLKESAQYYQRAVELDPGMERKLKSAIEKNRLSQEFMEAAKSSGFSGDTLRLALDVAA